MATKNYNTTWVADYMAAIIPVMDVKDDLEAEFASFRVLVDYLGETADLFRLEKVEEMPEGEDC